MPSQTENAMSQQQEVQMQTAASAASAVSAASATSAASQQYWMNSYSNPDDAGVSMDPTFTTVMLR